MNASYLPKAGLNLSVCVLCSLHIKTNKSHYRPIFERYRGIQVNMLYMHSHFLQYTAAYFPVSVPLRNLSHLLRAASLLQEPVR